MRLAVYSLVAALALTMASCDPIFGTQHRQALAPAPAPGCLLAALHASPLIASVGSDSSTRNERVSDRFAVSVHDPATPGGVWRGVAAQTTEAKSGSVWVSVTYEYPGFAQPTAAQRVRWDSQSREIVNGVRQACAPNSPAKIECKSLGAFGGNRRACRTAA